MSKRDMKYERHRPKYEPGVGITFDQGTTVPSDGEADYSPGCIFIHTDGAIDNQLLVNEGSLTSCGFVAVTPT